MMMGRPIPREKRIRAYSNGPTGPKACVMVPPGRLQRQDSSSAYAVTMERKGQPFELKQRLSSRANYSTCPVWVYQAQASFSEDRVTAPASLLAAATCLHPRGRIDGGVSLGM